MQEYYKRFMALKEVNESIDNSIHQDPGILEMVAKEHGQNSSNLSGDEKEAFIKEGQKRMLAMQMLMGADQKQFGSAIEDLKNLYLMNKCNNYPKTTHACFTLLKG